MLYIIFSKNIESSEFRIQILCDVTFSLTYYFYVFTFFYTLCPPGAPQPRSPPQPKAPAPNRPFYKELKNIKI